MFWAFQHRQIGKLNGGDFINGFDRVEINYLENFIRKNVNVILFQTKKKVMKRNSNVSNGRDLVRSPKTQNEFLVMS